MPEGWALAPSGAGREAALQGTTRQSPAASPLLGSVTFLWFGGWEAWPRTALLSPPPVPRAPWCKIRRSTGTLARQQASSRDGPGPRLGSSESNPSPVGRMQTLGSSIRSRAGGCLSSTQEGQAASGGPDTSRPLPGRSGQSSARPVGPSAGKPGALAAAGPRLHRPSQRALSSGRAAAAGPGKAPGLAARAGPYLGGSRAR